MKNRSKFLSKIIKIKSSFINKEKFLSRIFQYKICIQFITFTGVGAIGTLAHYITLIMLVNIAGVNPVIASGNGFVVGAFVNYYLNYHVTFRSNKRHAETFIKFFSIALVGLLINTFLMYITTELMKINYILSQIFTTGVVLIWNFLCNRLWTFKEGKDAK